MLSCLLDCWVCVGVTHVGGDMFKSIPNGDAIFMKVHNIYNSFYGKELKRS